MIKPTMSVLAFAILLAGCNQMGGTRVAAAPPMPAGAQALPVSTDTVRQIQSALQARGFYGGAIDGQIGGQTQAALENYQQSKGLARTGVLDDKSLQDLLANKPANSPNNVASSGYRADSDLMTTDQIRNHLESMGYSSVDNLRLDSGGNYNGTANRNGTQHMLQIDGHSGQVISEH